MSFCFRGLEPDPFRPLFLLSDAELKARGMRRMIADAKPGFPCRVSLEDAEPGERLILLAAEHMGDVRSPYRASGPIFVREAAGVAYNGTEVPEVLRARLLSLRAYDADGMMVDADVVEGRDAEPEIERLFARADVVHIHVHNAKRGCYSCLVERVDETKSRF